MVFWLLFLYFVDSKMHISPHFNIALVQLIVGAILALCQILIAHLTINGVLVVKFGVVIISTIIAKEIWLWNNYKTASASHGQHAALLCYNSTTQISQLEGSPGSLPATAKMDGCCLLAVMDFLWIRLTLSGLKIQNSSFLSKKLISR